MRNPLSKVITEIEPSGIRKFFDIVSEMKDAISLGVGEPDFDTPWHIRDEGIYSLEKGRTFYTSNAGLKELKIEISNFLNRKYGLDYDYNHEIMVTVGGSEAIDIAMRAMLDPGDEVLIPQPSYVSYLPCARLAGGVPVVIELKAENQFRLTRDELEAAITPKTKILVLPFPNNPTGAVMERSDLEELVDVIVANDLYVITDEIYSELTYTEEGHVSIAAMPGMRDRTIYINGLSKSHRVAGYRIGWMCLCGRKDHVKGYIEGLNLLSSMRLCSNVPAQSIVQTSLGGYQSADELLLPGGRIYEQREYIYNALCDIPGVSVVKPKAAFYIFPKLDQEKFHIKDDEKFALDLLREKKILITCGTGFNCTDPDHFRIVYLPNIVQLKTAMGRIADFLSYYHQ